MHFMCEYPSAAAMVTAYTSGQWALWAVHPGSSKALEGLVADGVGSSGQPLTGSGDAAAAPLPVAC